MVFFVAHILIVPVVFSSKASTAFLTKLISTCTIWPSSMNRDMSFVGLVTWKAMVSVCWNEPYRMRILSKRSEMRMSCLFGKGILVNLR